MSETRLIVRVGQAPALRLDPAGGRYASEDAAEWLAAANALSCGWQPPLDMVRLANWLDHLLPENGQRQPLAQTANAALERHGIRREALGAADILWGSPGLECPGAVTVGAELAGEAVDAAPVSRTALDDEAVGRMVRWAAYQTAGHGPMPVIPEAVSRASLSGARPKIGIRHDRDAECWYAADSSRLSTHIVKQEDSPSLPGEAIAEAVSLRALAHAGIPAAQTTVRVFGGASCVVSERTDRIARDGEIVARHQESWGQAACLGTNEKFAYQRPDPGWPGFHALLCAASRSPDSADESFLNALIACALLAHTDLHRQNIGFLHTDDGDTHVEIAPMYDVCCADGRPETYTRGFALPIGGATAPERFDAQALAQLADDCGIARELAATCATRVAERLPDALVEAKRESLEADEKRVPEEANARLEAMSHGVESRCLRLAYDVGRGAWRRGR